MFEEKISQGNKVSFEKAGSTAFEKNDVRLTQFDEDHILQFSTVLF